ncbi:hypothetical protein GRI40_06150 [Altererythrobacter aerius]|uniref:Uncharacterized protein n=1 Tax=Tsuneonella aeria TaxID=1837929 RepID=A0A6I4TBT8_9SPHN|nr:hypothetical protein [Tsuneonella aeria]MXO74801.1 hypothetical protein [Tsuneonella aeria]
MSPAVPNRLPGNVLRISVDTVDPVPAKALLAWAGNIVSFLESLDEFPGDATVSVRHVGSGSSVAELVFLGIGAMGASLSAISAVGLLAIAYQKSLEDGHPQTASPLVSIVNVYGGSTVTVSHGDEEPLVVYLENVPGYEEIDWENSAGLPGVQVQKLRALENAEALQRPDRPALLVGSFLRKLDGTLIFENRITGDQLLAVTLDDDADAVVPLGDLIVVRGSIGSNDILSVETIEYIEPIPTA